MIEAKIIEDSINEAQSPVRLTTFVLKYPRFILAEVNTHRALSRSSASSRAIPMDKMIAQVENDPFLPLFWGKNQPGMQSEEELSGEELRLAKAIWLNARDEAVKAAKQLKVVGLHKQLGNRILEPWMWTQTVLTATDLGNFFNLRYDLGAQPELKILTEKMLEALVDSEPRVVSCIEPWCNIEETEATEWHLPFVTQEERQKFGIEDLLKFSVARCARVSYANHEGVVDHQKDRDLHDRLISSGHMSPLEHQAIPALFGCIPMREGNFRGWKQYRKEILEENKSFFKATIKGKQIQWNG